MKILKGKIVDFKSSRDSRIGYLSIKDSGTGLVFSVPCDSKSIAEDLEEYFGDVISSTGKINEVGGHIFQEIFWSYDQDGRLFGSFVPVDKASDDIVDHNNIGKKEVHNLDLRNNSVKSSKL